MSEATKVGALAALSDDDGRALLSAVSEAWARLAPADRDPEVMGEALAVAASMLAGDPTQNMARLGAASVKVALRDYRRDVAGRADRGEMPRPLSLDGLVDALGDALAVMPDGRLTVADPDPASAYAIRPQDVATTAVTALKGKDAERAAGWIKADVARARGRRWVPSEDAAREALATAVLAWDPAGDPCGTAHPRTARSDRSVQRFTWRKEGTRWVKVAHVAGGWQTTDGDALATSPDGTLTRPESVTVATAAWVVASDGTTVRGRTAAEVRVRTAAEDAVLLARPERVRAAEDAAGDTAPLAEDVRSRPRLERAVTGWVDPVTGRPCGHGPGDVCPCVPKVERVRPSLTRGDRDGEAADQTWNASASRGVSAPSRRKRGSDGPSTLPVGARTR